MTTELTTTEPTDLAAADPVADALADVLAECEATDPGPMAQTEDERALHRVAKYRARLVDERARVAEMTRRMLAELDRRIDGVDYHYGPLLADVTRRLLGNGKARSVKTPSGVAGFRKTPAALVVVDEAAVPDWAVEVEMVRKVVRKRLVEHFEATGEIPAGCELRGEEDRFFIR